jgi:hypothetical protein
MILGDGVLAGRIVRSALDWSNVSATAQAALELLLHFRAPPLLERIGATKCKEHPSDHEQDRRALHLLILGMNCCIARTLQR